MRELLMTATDYSIMLIDAVALAAIVFGTIEVVIAVLRSLVSRDGGREPREIWLRYARWLVAGLTFQLAADIVETSITTDWEAVARIAAIAVIRTFLNYFLERDVNEVTERGVKPASTEPA